ncbi:hypothetical protein V500_07468 [Pseudogymnoascus sp. VKM F-4518 (FW-2643)]|nr:hypothetical protein V500_07468 [Pseudogymnoascus sp. VKM F-4518 (FW-2643)]
MQVRSSGFAATSARGIAVARPTRRVERMIEIFMLAKEELSGLEGAVGEEMDTRWFTFRGFRDFLYAGGEQSTYRAHTPSQLGRALKLSRSD